MNNIKDAGGKNYSKAVLFGDYYDLYLGMLCVHYNLYKTDKDIPKYIKMHIDDGLSLLNEEVNNHSNIDGFDFLDYRGNRGGITRSLQKEHKMYFLGANLKE